MTDAIVQRTWLTVPLLAGAAVVYGALVAVNPGTAITVTYLVGVAYLAFRAPVAHLTILIGLTTIVPYSIQNGYGAGSGLLPADLFLFTGLARAAIVLPRVRLTSRQLTTLLLTIAFCAIAVFAAYRGHQLGRATSDVGSELRTLLGFSVALITMAALIDAPARRRLTTGLLVLGLLLGLWGIAQWLGNLSYAGSSDFGVREGVSFTSAGRGQVQGGLFAFPLAVIIPAAALVSGRITNSTTKLLVWTVIVLNGVSLLLTFERTFWVATVFGLLVVILKASRAQRARALVWALVIVIAGFVALSTLSPGTLATARERLLSIGQYKTDDSLRYRRVESEHVINEIRSSPWTGSGLAATIWWGRPWEQVPPRSYRYSHNAYLWLAWRLGILGALLLFVLLGLACFWRGPPAGGPLVAAVRTGCQASLLALLVASVTFPAFNGYGITSAMGMLIGICSLPRGPRVAPESRQRCRSLH